MIIQTKDEMIHALQTPQKAPFRVTFEIFASTERRDIAKWPKKLAELMKLPAMEFLMEHERETYTAEAAEANKAESIDWVKKNLIEPANRLLSRLEIHTAQYNRVKEYFNQKIIELGLTNPLIFFDDKALRIDIGYGPKEILALFPDFFAHRGVFDETILGDVSFFGKSPLQYFLDDYIEEDYKDFLSAEKQRILSSASTEFTKSLAPKRKVNPEETRGFKEAELIKKCFETSTGLIVGEVHEHKSPKQFLVDNMPLFKSQGVTTIYIEHLLQERHQSLLDAYLHSAPDATMPRELELYLNYLDKERNLSGSTTFTAVVQAAKKHQIRIVAIDSEATYSIGVTDSLGDLGNTQATKERYSAMNMAMLDRYKEFNDGGKYIAFIGSGHVSTCLDVPGVSELLGSPNIVVNDLDESIEEHIEQDILLEIKPQVIRFDMLYHRHQGTKQLTASVVTKSSTAENTVPAVPVDDNAVMLTPSSEVGIQKNIIDFENNKKKIQEQFIENLTTLKLELNKCDNTPSKMEVERLYTNLLRKQEEFFKALTLQSTEKELKTAIIDFRKSCKENIEIADKIMGHGWLYRIAEVLIKAVVGLFVGIGMVVGSLFGQGLVKSEHRQKFANTFFTLNQTDESKALDTFKQEILGDEKEEPGLLSDSKFKLIEEILHCFP